MEISNGSVIPGSNKETDNHKVIIRSHDITEEDYQKLCNSPYLSIDTETTGLNLNRDRLCLVQICNEELVILIHYPSLEHNSPNLKKLLSQPMEKIFHYARFDIMSIYKYLGILCENIICTRMLSKITRTNSERHGLKHLLEELLDVKINKGQQLSYWGDENITQSQKEYAKKDVIYLKALYDKLKRRAERENRWDLAKKMFVVIPTVVLCESNFFDPISLINYA